MKKLRLKKREYHLSYNVRKILIVQRHISEWFEREKIEINKVDIEVISKNYRNNFLKECPNPKVEFNIDENNLRDIYNQYMKKKNDNDGKPIISPWKAFKYNNPTKGKEGNYRKLIYTG